MRLLIAEDEKSLAKALGVILEKSGYSADQVYDGISALEYLETGNYDGMILDIMMPGMDGLAVLRKIREQGSRLPVLLLTAKAEVDDKVEGLVDKISREISTGSAGDGKIFIRSIEEVVRIRTGERGSEAI